MGKKMHCVRMVFCMVLVLIAPLLVSGEDNPVDTEPKLQLEKARPLAPEVKLERVNKTRKEHSMKRVENLEPAQITLSPAHPNAGSNNFITAQAYFMALPEIQCIAFRYRHDRVWVHFATEEGKTYLLDVTALLANSWRYQLISQMGVTVEKGNLTQQDGHILLPFIAPGQEVIIALSPGGPAPTTVGDFGEIRRIELTRVD